MHRGITEKRRIHREKKWCSLSEEEYAKWRKKRVVEDLHRKLAQVVVVLPGEQPVQKKSLLQTSTERKAAAAARRINEREAAEQVVVDSTGHQQLVFVDRHRRHR